MKATGWNHNVYYYPLVVSAVPRACRAALDVGCGEGELARLLASRCEHVTALDVDAEVLAEARRRTENPGIAYIHGDLMSHDFGGESFDFVAAVASVHHLPLRPALLRMASLLKPEGVLFILGLYRLATVTDFAWAAAAHPISWGGCVVYGNDTAAAPIREPRETLKELRTACQELLPGGRFQRRLFFRYSYEWRKPRSAA